MIYAVVVVNGQVDMDSSYVADEMGLEDADASRLEHIENGCDAVVILVTETWLQDRGYLLRD